MSTPADLAAAKEWLQVSVDSKSPSTAQVHATVLLAALAELERQAAESEDGTRWRHFIAKIDALEAEVERLTANLRAATDIIVEAEKLLPGVTQTVGRFVIGDVAEARARAETAEAEVERLTRWHSIELREREAAEARAQQLEEALREIGAQQQKTLAVIESNGFVFDSIGKEPGNWQHLAFTIYTDLCQVDTIAHQALDAVRAAVLAAGPSKEPTP